LSSSVFSAFAVGFDPLRDKSYRKTALGRSVVDFLAWKRVGKAAERTLETYEWVLSRLCLMFPKLGVRELAFGHAEFARCDDQFEIGEDDARFLNTIQKRGDAIDMDKVFRASRWGRSLRGVDAEVGGPDGSEVLTTSRPGPPRQGGAGRTTWKWSWFFRLHSGRAG